MAYTDADFLDDAAATARCFDLAYVRAQRLLNRWFNGFNQAFPSSTFPDLNNLMSVLQSHVQDHQKSGNAKLNTVLKFSDLRLPRE